MDRISLAAVAWFGLQFFTSTPPDVTCSSRSGIERLVDPGCAADVRLDGEILYRTKLSDEMFEGFRRGWAGSLDD